MDPIQRIGIEDAKAKGKYTGRKPTARNKRAEVVALAEQGKTRTAIAAELCISERSVYRVLQSA